MNAPAQKPLRWPEIERIRRTRGQSVLLFITDRCPVGCAHCSVDSRRDSPTITDFELFDRILDWICEQSQLEVVGISGGEPFVERRGLTLAVRRMAGAGKRLVIYTSGTWATRPRPPAWIRDVLARSSTVFLSTDTFHRDGVADSTYAHAAHAIAAAGAWIVVQVIDTEPILEQARMLLRAVFGDHFDNFAEIRPVAPLTHGRGVNVFKPAQRWPGHTFPACAAVESPMLRYDGLVTGCCNESVIMGYGPARLRRRAHSRGELAAAMDGFHKDPLLRAIGGVGPGALTIHPRFADFAEEEFTHICDLCWKLLDRVEGDERPDPLIDAIDAIGRAES